LPKNRQNETMPALGPDDNFLAVGTYAGEIHLFDIRNGKGSGILRGHAQPVDSLAVAPDGKSLASAGKDGLVQVWDIAKQKPLYSLTTKSDINVMAFVSAGKTLVVSGADEKEIRLCDATTGTTARTLKQARANCLAATADGKYLAAGGMLDARVWDLKTGDELTKVNSSQKGMTSAVALTPDGKTLITASADQTIKLWDVPSGSERKVFPAGHKNYVLSMALTADGKMLATAAADGTARLWEVTTGRPLAVCEGGKNDRIVGAVAITKDGKTLLTGAEEGLKTWDLSGIGSR
jgi:WD40 repeat protein